MAKRYICGGTTYAIGGPQEDTIILPIQLADLPETIRLERYTLLRRTAFHVSLVCAGKIFEKYHPKPQDFIAETITDFCAYVQTHPIQLIRFRDEFRFAAEKERRAVICMCDMLNLEGFFDLLNEKYSLHIPYPPTHATLYTLQPDVGIFVTDSADLQQLTKEISGPMQLPEVK